MTHEGSAPGFRPSIGFWLLIALLAASGVTMAVIVALGLSETKAFTVAWSICVADLYLIASLAARHRWLRIAIWVGTAVTFLGSLVIAFLPEVDQYRESSTQIAGGWEWERTPYGVFVETVYSLHVIVATLVLLGFVSLGYRYVRGDRVLRTIYMLTFVTALAAAVVIAFDLAVQPGGNWYPAQVSLAILALTGAAIVIIGALVQRRAAHAVAPLSATGTGVIVIDRAELRELVRAMVAEELADRRTDGPDAPAG